LYFQSSKQKSVFKIGVVEKLPHQKDCPLREQKGLCPNFNVMVEPATKLQEKEVPYSTETQIKTQMA
jgi:hypothetical protein